MLRASSEHNGDEIDIAALTGTAVGDSGIAHGDKLVAFAEAVIGDGAKNIKPARAAVKAALGDAALVDAAGIIGMFNGLDRVADATGAPLEDWKAADTADMRAAIGIDSFAATKAEIEAGSASLGRPLPLN
jgi:hypothetical protein